MVVKDRRPCPHGTGETPPPPATGPAAAAAGLDALLGALPPAAVAERRPVARLAPGREPAVAAERFVVSREKLAAELGPAIVNDEDLLRHAADRVAARLPGSAFSPGAAGTPTGGVSERLGIRSLRLGVRGEPEARQKPDMVALHQHVARRRDLGF